ncbi:aminoglycoside phosphotransferase family protein [Streptomyces radicis]|uniref:aminoglycoside phosphotransferase family protein n=1 Tax=Streptomyces radicis TaxID=1750517 RepID=UPI0015FF2A43|nr:aminoglycoside phosphotransferase family protein [Streptomyces radicis]
MRDLHEGQGPWLIEATAHGSTDHAVLRVESPGKPADYLRIEAAALTRAARHGAGAPRPIGIDDRRHTGQVATLQTVLAGRTVASQPYDGERLRSVGEQLARIHRLRVDPGPDLPERRRPLEPDGGYTEEKRRGAEHPTRRSRDGARLLAHAERELARHPRPDGERGLVHGDTWLGNIMSDGVRVTGLIDWGCAGVGHPGIDLGHARLSAAFGYGLDAADDILTGWRRETGLGAPALPYWDVIAALETAPDMGKGTDVRDAFLRRALAALGQVPSG